MKRFIPGPAAAAVLAGAGIIVFLLLIIPVGMADNGDFLRIMATVGLDYADPALSAQDKYFGWFLRDYSFAAPFRGGYVSTEILLVALAAGVSRLATWGSHFDIRFLSVLYGSVLLASFWIILRSLRGIPAPTRWALAAVAVIVFCDAGYLVYFNSLYGEPVSYVFLLLTAALALAIARTDDPRRRLLVLFFIAAAFFIGAKVQNAPSGLLFALLGWRFAARKPERSWKKTAWTGSVLLVLFSAAIYLLDPKEIRVINQYQSVFYGILKDSPHPEKDLEELGVDPKYAVLKGTNFFTPNTPIKQTDPILQKDVYDKVGMGNIALFYFMHPSRLLDKLQVSAENGFTIHMGYLGNYEKAPDVPPGKQVRAFTWWSEFKNTKIPHSLAGLAFFYVVYFGVLLWRRMRATGEGSRLVCDLLLVIGLTGLLNFVVPVLGSGEADLQKHLFLFNVCLDLALAAAASWLVGLAFFNRVGHDDEAQKKRGQAGA